MLMPVTHLLDTIDTVPTISPMKKKISPERKIKLHRAEDLRVTTSSSEQSDSEWELEFTPNQILQLQQTLPIYPRNVAQFYPILRHIQNQTQQSVR